MGIIVRIPKLDQGIYFLVIQIHNESIEEYVNVVCLCCKSIDTASQSMTDNFFDST
jgi:hypothetical protein